jgi:hypothetical protein
MRHKNTHTGSIEAYTHVSEGIVIVSKKKFVPRRDVVTSSLDGIVAKTTQDTQKDTLRGSAEEATDVCDTEFAKHSGHATKFVSKESLFLSLLLVASTALLATVSQVEYTVSYLSDTDEVKNNTLSAGSVDFSIANTASSTLLDMQAFVRNNFYPRATSSISVSVLPEQNTGVIKYSPFIEYVGDIDEERVLCEKLYTVARLEPEGTDRTVEMYRGVLSEISVVSTTTAGLWHFTFVAPRDTPHGVLCPFDIVFRGVQNEHNFSTEGYGGFRDIEREYILFATWGVRVQKVHVASDERGHDWVELYNQSNQRVDVSGWRICNKNSCDIIPKTLPIPPRGFAIIVPSASALSSIHIPRGVRKIVLEDGAIGGGLFRDADMLALYGANDSLVDTLNWGTAETTAEIDLTDVNKGLLLDFLWLPAGVQAPDINEVLMRVPTGYDTNAPEDFETRTFPDVDFVFPRPEKEYRWRWGDTMNIRWLASDSTHIKLFVIKDTDGTGDISDGDKVRAISGSHLNDGHFEWRVPWGYTGVMWLRVLSISTENPFLQSEATSNKIEISAPPRFEIFGLDRIIDIFGNFDLPGQMFEELFFDFDLSKFVSPLFDNSLFENIGSLEESAEETVDLNAFMEEALSSFNFEQVEHQGQGTTTTYGIAPNETASTTLNTISSTTPTTAQDYLQTVPVFTATSTSVKLPVLLQVSNSTQAGTTTIIEMVEIEDQIIENETGKSETNIEDIWNGESVETVEDENSENIDDDAVQEETKVHVEIRESSDI